MEWTKEAVYDEQISPLMRQIIAVCKEHQIPLVAVFQYANNEDRGPAYCTTCIPAPHQSEHMGTLGANAKPRAPVAFAETIETHPDGSKTISVRRMS